ncbi:MAG: outer membrane protein assembly factor BamA, partial [Pseudomonadota bacterium]
MGKTRSGVVGHLQWIWTTFLAMALIVVLAVPALGQSIRINSIDVDGNRRIETSTIISFAGIERGAALTTSQVNDAIQRVRASGLFESVDAQVRGSTLVLTVVEFPTVNRVAFEGNRRLDDEDLARIVRISPRRIYSATQVEADAANISEAYANQGRLLATVTPRIIRRTENRVDVVFEVQEGGVVEIERISFVGNRQYSDRRLRRVLETKQAGFFRLLGGRVTFVEDRIQFDRQVLTDFYQSRGFIDFQTLGVNAELAESRDAFFLTFRVREGQQFRFGNITASSDLPQVDVDMFDRALRSRTSGAVYSPKIVEDTITRMERRAVALGLDFIRVEPRVTRNDADLTLDLDYVITRGERVFVERIDIEGNTTTLDRVVRRQFDSVEGDPFNPRAIRASAERIRALGFFGNADVNAREGSTPSQVIIDVDVAEQPTGSFSFGANFNSDDGLGFIANFREANFLGRGQALS